MKCNNFFDNIAWIYNPIRKYFSGDYKEQIQLIEEFSGLNKKSKLLDVGGGTGIIAQAFSDKVKEITIIDPSQKMLSKASSIKIKKMVGIVQKMPFNDNSFDIVYCVDSFHHFTNGYDKKEWPKIIKKSIKELLRVLKKKGILLIIEYDPDTNFGKMIEFFENKLMKLGSCFYNSNELKSLINNQLLIDFKYYNNYAYIMKVVKN